MSQPTDDEIRQRYGLPPGTRVVRLTPDALGRVRVTPDAFAYVEVEPALEWATWDRPVAVAGATVQLSVQGALVGEGSPVVVTVRDSRNRVVGRGAGAMYRDRAVVEVAVDRRAAERDPDGVLCAADVELTEPGLTVVSAPLWVLPFAELVDARWGVAEARDGDAVELSCRVTGTSAGVERLEGQTAEVEILRGGEGSEDGVAGALFEPVATLRVPVREGRVEAAWRVGYDAEGKAQIATQAELDEVAARSGGAAERYRRPVWRFRVRLAGLEAESGFLTYRDWIRLEFLTPEGEPHEGIEVVVVLADGTEQRHTVDADGAVRVEPAPPGPVTIRTPHIESSSPGPSSDA